VLAIERISINYNYLKTRTILKVDIFSINRRDVG